MSLLLEKPFDSAGKQSHYLNLVAARKLCTKCRDVVNPSACDNGKFDERSEIGPWTDWQGNLDSALMVVGQEWGGTENYRRQGGLDIDGDPTNFSLRALLREMGSEVPPPSKLQGTTDRGCFFFTNSVLCLRNGNASNSMKIKNEISDGTFRTCASTFLRPQIELVQPRWVVVLGKQAWNGLMRAFAMPTSNSFSTAVDSSPIRLNAQTQAIPLFHCGARSTNMNRDFGMQQADWARAHQAMTSERVASR